MAYRDARSIRDSKKETKYYRLCTNCGAVADIRAKPSAKFIRCSKCGYKTFKVHKK